MESIKEMAGLAAIGLLFSLFTWALVSSYIEEYDFSAMEPATARTVEKIGKKGLFTPPAYHVRVVLPNGDESPYMNRISKSKMNGLSVGDKIDGYSAGPSDFSTVHDILYDSLYYFIGMAALGFIAFCCLFACFLSIPGIERIGKKTPSKRKKKRKRKKHKKSREQVERKGWRIAGVTIMLFLIYLAPALLNTARKLLPFGKTETNVFIYDSDSYVTYRKYEDSAYELTISFKDLAGNTIQVIKDVTSHTYGQYTIGDILPISYRNADPYDVFVRNASGWDFFHAMLTMQAFVYLSISAVTVFVGWAYWTGGRKK